MLSNAYAPDTGLPYLVVFLELVKAIAWPIAALLIVHFFSGELKALFPKIKKIGPAGIEVASQPEPSAEISIENPFGRAMLPLTDPVAKEIEDQNRHELNQLATENHIDVLLRAVTIHQLQKSFALAYASMFGSQIRMLESLNVGEMGETDVNDMYARTWLCCTNRLRVGLLPFPGQTYPTAWVTGMPSAVKPFKTATRTWNSAT
jgi:hypothetical protein